MSPTAISPREKSDSRVTAKLISRIKRMIASGAIAPGSKFPPERELAKEFGVNRASVRQVLKVLEIMGVLTQRVGDGTYLSDSAESILNQPLDFLVLLDDLSHHELFETRLIVEPELAARAAERATAEDMAALRNAIFAMERSKSNRERLDADLSFHEAVFRASGNRICHLLFKEIHRSLLASMSHLSDRVSLDQPLKFHRRIYAAIREHKGDEARRAMFEHLTDARSLLIRSDTNHNGGAFSQRNS
ncbi:MAG TPA: FadR/GntR family transcriptional regulator [Acidobacteriaceae bacterium]|nr:FadR/GntR family transcriptional regulator [Acidobacteriaceae bacterium]